MSEKVQAKLAQIKALVELEPFQHSASDLADRFDVSDNSIRILCRKYNLNLARHVNEELPKIKRFIREHSFQTSTQIARELHQDAVYISNLAARIGVRLANRGRKPVDNDPNFFNYKIHGRAF